MQKDQENQLMIDIAMKKLATMPPENKAELVSESGQLVLQEIPSLQFTLSAKTE